MNQSPASGPSSLSTSSSPSSPSSPSSTDPTSLLPLPVTEATLLEDRAELTRRARLTGLADPGAQAGPGGRSGATVRRLRLGPVTPLLVDHSLRGELHGAPEGARVLDLRVVRRWSPQPPSAAIGGPGPDASEVERRVHELSEQLRRAELELSRRTSRVAVLEQLLAELRREITETAGAGECEPSVSRGWHERLDRAEEEHEAQSELLRATRHRQGRLKQELIQAQIAWGEAESRPPVLVAELEVTLEFPASAGPSEAGSVAGPQLLVRHLVPCALWRPAYRATLSGDEAELLLERDAFLWQRTGEDWTDVRVTLSTARPALASEPPFLPQDLLVLRDRGAEERRTIEVDLREVEIPDLGPDQAALPEESASAAAPAAVVPGVDDGGEARRLLVPEPVSVPSDGRAHRVGLGGFRAAATVEVSCAPELSPLVFRTARFRNAAGQPLLSGPVDLVRGSGFVGRGELRFTAAEAVAELCFGSEDGFRVVRSVTETRGGGSLAGALTGRSARSREVGVTLSRFAPTGEGPARVVLRERIPVSEVAAVEVRVDKDRTDPQPDALDAEGVARWELSLGPDESRSVLLRYEILAARSVALPE